MSGDLTTMVPTLVLADAPSLRTTAEPVEECAEPGCVRPVYMNGLCKADSDRQWYESVGKHLPMAFPPPRIDRRPTDNPRARRSTPNVPTEPSSTGARGSTTRGVGAGGAGSTPVGERVAIAAWCTSGVSAYWVEFTPGGTDDFGDELEPVEVDAALWSAYKAAQKAVRDLERAFDAAAGQSEGEGRVKERGEL